jgi:hypothetical protein
MTDPTPLHTATLRAIDDPEAQEVAALVARGVAQPVASGLVYRRHLPDNADATVRRAWVRLVVGDLFAPLREAVGL